MGGARDRDYLHLATTDARPFLFCEFQAQAPCLSFWEVASGSTRRQPLCALQVPLFYLLTSKTSVFNRTGPSGGRRAPRSAFFVARASTRGLALSKPRARSAPNHKKTRLRESPVSGPPRLKAGRVLTAFARESRTCLVCMGVHMYTQTAPANHNYHIAQDALAGTPAGPFETTPSSLYSSLDHAARLGQGTFGIRHHRGDELVTRLHVVNECHNGPARPHGRVGVTALLERDPVVLALDVGVDLGEVARELVLELLHFGGDIVLVDALSVPYTPHD
mmetsp:Transcript_8858/g.20656  ORF Transcript_8858/g.20656 Transcript_8858/m.20656 type:complete len:277 (-) Transcript_8858:860-1690(-)